MRYVLALLAAVNAWGVMPASSEECELGLSSGIVRQHLHRGIDLHRGIGPTPSGAGPEDSTCQRRGIRISRNDCGY